MDDTFDKIISREYPAKIFYEDDDVIVIQDLYPKAPVHLLLIPKEKSKNFYEASLETLAVMGRTVKKVAELLKIEDHFQIDRKSVV